MCTHLSGLPKSLLLGAQRANDGVDRVFLEEADGGDAGGAGLQARMRILQGYSSKGKHWNLGAAGLAERF